MGSNIGKFFLKIFKSLNHQESKKLVIDPKDLGFFKDKNFLVFTEWDGNFIAYPPGGYAVVFSFVTKPLESAGKVLSVIPFSYTIFESTSRTKTKELSATMWILGFGRTNPEFINRLEATLVRCNKDNTLDILEKKQVVRGLRYSKKNPF